MDKRVQPFSATRGTDGAHEPEGVAVMSYVWDRAHPEHPPGVVRTLGLRESLEATRWTHAVSEVTWGSVAYLRMPASSDEDVDAAHEVLVAVLQGQPWPDGFDEAVRRWGVG